MHEPTRISFALAIPLAIAFAALLAAAAAGEPPDSAPQVEVARGGATEWRVFLHPGSLAPGRFARDELKKYIERMSGARPGDAEAPGSPRTIWLGLRRDAVGIEGLPEAGKGHDGYAVSVLPRSIAGEKERKLLASQRIELVDPAAAAVRGDPVLERRVGKVEKLHGLAERLAEMHRRRDEIRSIRQGGDLRRAARLLEEARAYTDGVMDLFRSLADLDQGLMDRNEVPGFIRLRVKGWVDEEAKALVPETKT